MEIRFKIYHILVNRIPAIQKKYDKIRQQYRGIAGRLYSWTMLLFMNIKWALGMRESLTNEWNPDAKKRLPKEGVESTLLPHASPQELAGQLAESDIISFDIFDTLIFRPFSAPEDLFYLIGDKLRYMDFKRIRQEAEKEARQKAKKERDSYEVRLTEIYEELARRTGIQKEAGMSLEIETEMECCYGNPYMQDVFTYLKKKIQNTRKKIICVSDMYLPCETVRQLLTKCGFDQIDEIVLSCEYGLSKSDGSLYRAVMDKYGKNRTYVHVGDHEVSDVQKARQSGWRALCYPNVNKAGRMYRAEDMSVIAGSFYRGIVNARLYTGLQIYSKEFESGYVYGGLFVLGYCQFIHQYACRHKTDKLLFLARDGDILYKMYEKLYPEEKGRMEYVYWSRTAAAKLAADYYKEDYFRRFLHHKVNQNFTMRQIFQSMQLEDMLDGLCAKKKELQKETVLTQKNESIVKEYLMNHWEEVLAYYEPQRKAAERYYKKILSNCQTAVTIDVGWAGSGSLILDYLVNQVWKLDCNITGLLAGTNTMSNAQPDMSEYALYSGKLNSYLFSQEHNRDIWKSHQPGKNHNLLLEMLLSSREGSMTGFQLDETAPDGYRFQFKKPDMPSGEVSAVQKGIEKFIDDFFRLVPDTYAKNHCVSGSDCYAVLRILLQSKEKVSIEMHV